jgi:predicted kinase
MRPTLHFLCGKMAAGKSTLAKQLAQQHRALLISEDIWLQRLYGDEITDFNDYLLYSRRLKSALTAHIIEILQQDVSVVLDFPANVPAIRQWIREIFEAAQAEHVLHFVNTPNARCLAQLNTRNLAKPEGSIAMSAEQFAQITALFVEPAAEEGFNIQHYS